MSVPPGVMGVAVTAMALAEEEAAAVKELAEVEQRINEVDSGALKGGLLRLELEIVRKSQGLQLTRLRT